MAPRPRLNVLKKRQIYCYSRESNQDFLAIQSRVQLNLQTELLWLVWGFTHKFIDPFFCWPFAVAARSKAWVFSRLIAGIAGSNPAGAWVSVCCECCVLSDPSSRGVLPSVVCLSVISKPQQ